MSVIKCFILEDLPLATTILTSFIVGHPGLSLVGSADLVADARDQIAALKPDLVFLDIDLPDGEGSTLAYELKDTGIGVIMTTGHTHFALESYNLSVIDYLVKPIAFDRFNEAIGKALKILNAGKVEHEGSNDYPHQKLPDHVLVRSGGAQHRIQFDKVKFLEANGENVKIVLSDSSILIIHQAFYKFIDLLPPSQFLRIHRSFVVNEAFIKQFNSRSMSVDGKELPIGRNYYQQVKERLKKVS